MCDVTNLRIYEILGFVEVRPLSAKNNFSSVSTVS